MVFKKIIFQNRYVELETPRFMEKTILNFHFDYLNTSLEMMTWEMMCPFSLPISLFSSSTVVPMVEPGKFTITKTHIEYLEHRITKAQKAEVSEAYNPPSIWVTKVPSLSDNSDGRQNLAHFLDFHSSRPARLQLGLARGILRGHPVHNA